MKVRIGLGLSELPFSSAEAFWRWVRLCEDGGVDSLWQSDRLVSAAPFLESLSAMAALAGATRRLKFGMNVLALGFREPLVVAKACATIDFLSGGRLLPGFGLGSPTSPDWAATGAATEGRGGRFDEALEIIGRLWRGEAVSFQGRHFQYAEASIRPLPVQQPLPLWLGGSSPAAIRRTARFGTGWHAGALPPEEVAPVIRAIRAAAEAQGRPIDPEHFGASLFFRFGSQDDAVVTERRAQLRARFPKRDPERSLAVGGAGEILALLRAYVAAGASKFVLHPLSMGDEDALMQTSRLIEEVIPAAQG